MANPGRTKSVVMKERMNVVFEEAKSAIYLHNIYTKH